MQSGNTFEPKNANESALFGLGLTDSAQSRQDQGEIEAPLEQGDHSGTEFGIVSNSAMMKVGEQWLHGC